eukprot:jgi/Botrbrau1/21692/Bobra.43_1s0088.1
MRVQGFTRLSCLSSFHSSMRRETYLFHAPPPPPRVGGSWYECRVIYARRNRKLIPRYGQTSLHEGRFFPDTNTTWWQLGTESNCWKLPEGFIVSEKHAESSGGMYYVLCIVWIAFGY